MDFDIFNFGKLNDFIAVLVSFHVSELLEILFLEQIENIFVLLLLSLCARRLNMGAVDECCHQVAVGDLVTEL